MRRKILSGKKGQALTEFAVAFIVFMAVMLIFTDMVRICYNWISLQYAVNEAIRYGSLGGGAPDRPTSIEARVASIAGELGVQNVTVSFTDDLGGSTPGGTEDFYRLQAVTPVEINPISELLLNFVGDYSGTYNVTAEAIARNEPFF